LVLTLTFYDLVKLLLSLSQVATTAEKL